MIELTTTRGNRFMLDEAGNVIGRSNGPKGWNYSGRWTIVGFKRRHHSAETISLAGALAGADVGQGWICDLDGNTFRMWGNERLESLTRLAPDREALLRSVWQIPA